MRKILTVILVAFLVIGGIAFIKTLVSPVQTTEKEEVSNKPDDESFLERDTHREEEFEETDLETDEDYLEEEAVNIDPETSASETEKKQEHSDDFEEDNEDDNLNEETFNGDGRMVRVNTEKVNLRREPNIEGKIIIVVREGDTGILVEEGEDGWSKVDFDGMVGYISRKCIDIE